MYQYNTFRLIMRLFSYLHSLFVFKPVLIAGGSNVRNHSHSIAVDNRFIGSFRYFGNFRPIKHIKGLYYAK